VNSFNKKVGVDCIAVIVVLLSCVQVFAQAKKQLKSEERQELTGDIHTIAVFVDTDQECWSKGEKNHYYQQLRTSQDWISDEAIKYNASVTWHNDEFSWNQSTIYLNSYNMFSPRLMLEGTLDALGKSTVEDILKEQSGFLLADRVKLLFFVKNKDRSIAVNYWSRNKIDIGIISCRTSYGMKTDHYTISHELLHHFGAWDLYYGKSQSLAKAEKIKLLYPNSLMINTHVNKDQLEVDGLTASLIGWQEPDPIRLEEFKPVMKIRKIAAKNNTLLEPSGN